MKSVPCLRVEEGPPAFADLLAAARELGLRLGWLEWSPEATGAPRPVLAAGAAREVRVEALATHLAVARRGAPVLGDVLRSMFRGCDAVLVWGEVEAPLLRRVGDRWEVGAGGESPSQYDTPALLDALRRPSVTQRRWRS